MLFVEQLHRLLTHAAYGLYRRARAIFQKIGHQSLLEIRVIIAVEMQKLVLHAPGNEPAHRGVFQRLRLGQKGFLTLSLAHHVHQGKQMLLIIVGLKSDRQGRQIAFGLIRKRIQKSQSLILHHIGIATGHIGGHERD